MSPSPLKVVWVADPRALAETEWLLEILPAPLFQHARFESVKRHGDGAMYVISHPHFHPNEFATLVDSGSRFGVIHLSDEFLQAPLQIYSACAGSGGSKLVWRNYVRPGIPFGVHTFPLGYKQGFWRGYAGAPAADVTVAQREWVWSFVGQPKMDRAEMIEHFAPIGRHFTFHNSGWESTDSMPIERYRDTLLASVFCPSPHGNWNMECFRTWEILEAGAIPVTLSTGPNNPYPYYETLLGARAPWIVANDWPEAAALCAQWLGKPQQLEAMRRDIAQWWREYKAALAARIAQSIRACFGEQH